MINTNRAFTALYGLFLIIGVLAGCSKPQSETSTDHDNGRPPNIIFILADDLGWADLPTYGNPFNEAPNIERLAREGMTFTNAYAAAPVCSPTRASLQSGQYPARVGIIDFLPGHWRPYEKLTPATNRTQYLPLDITTMGEALKKAGYTTGYFGKWHLGRTEKYHPKNQGYDEAVVYQGGGYYGFGDRLAPPKEIPQEVRLSEALTDMSVNFIEQNKDSSFFLFLAHYDVHVQLDADADLIEKYLAKDKADGYPSNAVYAAMIEHLDRSVGRIIQKLDALGLSKNTMVVFFSDNGGLIKRFDEIPLIAQSKLHYYEEDTLRYIASSNDPLRAEKGTVYEGGIREPLIVKWPGHIKAGAESDAPVTSVDFYPTFMELAGAGLPPDQAFDGISILSQLKGSSGKKDRAIYWHYPVYHHEVPMGAIRKGNWKLVENFQTNEIELYNLEEDIGEENNLAEQNPGKRNELLTQLQEWRKSVHAEMPRPNPVFDPERRYVWKRHPEFQQMLHPE